MKIWAQKAKIGAGLAALLTFYATNPDNAIVQYITLKYPNLASLLGLLAALLLGGGLIKRDVTVKRDIKLKTDPLFGERKVIEPERVDTTVIQVKPITEELIVQKTTDPKE